MAFNPIDNYALAHTYEQLVLRGDSEREALREHERDRRALPPDGPDIGPDVPGGGAI